MFTTFLPKLIGSCIGKVPPSSWYFTHKLFNHLVWCVIWRKWRSQTICMLCEEVQHMSLLNSSAKTKVDIVTLFYILLFVHWCTNDSRARDWATHDFWRSWRWIKCKGIFMTLCKTRDVLLLEPKEVGGLARWRSSFNHRHKEMILASSQRATLLMHEHCTNVGVCWCSYHFFEEAALWDFQKYWSWWDC